MSIKTISISVDPEIDQKMEETKVNRSKLINFLLEQFLDRKPKYVEGIIKKLTK